MIRIVIIAIFLSILFYYNGIPCYGASSHDNKRLKIEKVHDKHIVWEVTSNKRIKAYVKEWNIPSLLHKEGESELKDLALTRYLRDSCVTNKISHSNILIFSYIGMKKMMEINKTSSGINIVLSISLDVDKHGRVNAVKFILDEKTSKFLSSKDIYEMTCIFRDKISFKKPLSYELKSAHLSYVIRKREIEKWLNTVTRKE